MIGAVIFDFDGVITDSEILHFRAFNEVLAKYGFQIAREDYYKDYLGLTDRELFETLAKNNKLVLNQQEVEKLLGEKKVVFKELATKEGRIIGGVREFVERLKENGVRMAICSGALRVEIAMILEEARLRDYFEVIVGAEDVKRGKPHPDGFLLTLKQLNQTQRSAISAKQCIIVEDSRWGLQAGQAAGMHTIAVTNSYAAEELKLAELVVSHLNEISLDKLEEICG